MILVVEHIVDGIDQLIRFIDYSNKNFTEHIISRKGIKKAIKSGELQLNNKIVESGRYLKNGDKIQLFYLENNAPKTYDLKLDVVFEDEFIAVINKPAGVLVSGNKYRTIVNSLPFNIKKSTEKDVLQWAKPVHRLDYQTSGLLIVAKTKTALTNLSKQFENKCVRKKYVAIVIGKPENFGTINLDIENKKSLTEYRVLNFVNSIKNKHLTLVELYPKTGRTHQLRIHLSSIGNPILGDKLYGNEGMIFKHKGLFLSSVGVIFKHPITDEEMSVEIEIPTKFNLRMEREQIMWEKAKQFNSNK